MHSKLISFIQPIVVLMFTTMLFGCSTAYQAPASGPTAQVKITTSNTDSVNIAVRRYNAPDCSDAPGELVGRMNSKTIGDTYSKELSFPVRANEPFRFSVLAAIDSSASINPTSILTLPLGFLSFNSKIVTCIPATEFTPIAGVSYEIEHTTSLTAGCKVKIFKRAIGSQQRTEELSAKPAKCDVKVLKQ